MKRGRAASISAAARSLVGAGDDLALGIVGRALLAPAHAKTVGLGAVLDDRHRLGRLAEGDGQHAGRERIERSRVTRLLGVEQELEPPDRLGRGDADRLVEIDPAVDLDAGRPLLRRLAAPARPASPRRSRHAVSLFIRSSARPLRGRAAADRARPPAISGARRCAPARRS